MTPILPFEMPRVLAFVVAALATIITANLMGGYVAVFALPTIFRNAVKNVKPTFGVIGLSVLAVLLLDADSWKIINALEFSRILLFWSVFTFGPYFIWIVATRKRIRRYYHDSLQAIVHSPNKSRTGILSELESTLDQSDFEADQRFRYLEVELKDKRFGSLFVSSSIVSPIRRKFYWTFALSPLILHLFFLIETAAMLYSLFSTTLLRTLVEPAEMDGALVLKQSIILSSVLGVTIISSLFEFLRKEEDWEEYISGSFGLEPIS